MGSCCQPDQDGRHVGSCCRSDLGLETGGCALDPTASSSLSGLRDVGDANVLVVVDASRDRDTTAMVVFLLSPARTMDLRGAFRVGLLFTASANSGQRDGSLLGDMAADSTALSLTSGLGDVGNANVLLTVDASRDMDTDTAVVTSPDRAVEVPRVPAQLHSVPPAHRIRIRKLRQTRGPKLFCAGPHGM